MNKRAGWAFIAVGAGLFLGCSEGDTDSGGSKDAPAAGTMSQPAQNAGSAAMPPNGMAGSAGSAGMSMTDAPMAGTEAGAAGSAGMGAAGVEAGMAGTGGMGGMAGDTPDDPPLDPSTCPPAPDGASDAAVLALDTMNAARLAAGAGCVNMVTEINVAAEKHCQYYAMNADDPMCIANPHGEVEGCPGYVGNVSERLAAAGYMPPGRFFGGGEVMAFANDPESAIRQWINSVWHRTPILSPWTLDFGYGAAEDCDTINFGISSMAPDDTLLAYPYDGQTEVPPSFNGMYEGPEPPEPPTGWPSSSPINLYGRELSVTEHVLTKDGDDTPIEHIWLDANDPMWSSYLRTTVFMYGYAPFEANTKYNVHMKGTHVGGDFERNWSFTTGEASRRGF